MLAEEYDDDFETDAEAPIASLTDVHGQSSQKEENLDAAALQGNADAEMSSYEAHNEPHRGTEAIADVDVHMESAVNIHSVDSSSALEESPLTETVPVKNDLSTQSSRSSSASKARIVGSNVAVSSASEGLSHNEFVTSLPAEASSSHKLSRTSSSSKVSRVPSVVHVLDAEVVPGHHHMLSRPISAVNASRPDSTNVDQQIPSQATAVSARTSRPSSGIKNGDTLSTATQSHAHTDDVVSSEDNQPSSTSRPISAARIHKTLSFTHLQPHSDVSACGEPGQSVDVSSNIPVVSRSSSRPVSASQVGNTPSFEGSQPSKDSVNAYESSEIVSSLPDAVPQPPSRPFSAQRVSRASSVTKLPVSDAHLDASSSDAHLDASSSDAHLDASSSDAHLDASPTSPIPSRPTSAHHDTARTPSTRSRPASAKGSRVHSATVTNTGMPGTNPPVDACDNDGELNNASVSRPSSVRREPSVQLLSSSDVAVNETLPKISEPFDVDVRPHSSVSAKKDDGARPQSTTSMRPQAAKQSHRPLEDAVHAQVDTSSHENVASPIPSDRSLVVSRSPSIQSLPRSAIGSPWAKPPVERDAFPAAPVESAPSSPPSDVPVANAANQIPDHAPSKHDADHAPTQHVAEQTFSAPPTASQVRTSSSHFAFSWFQPSSLRF